MGQGRTQPALPLRQRAEVQALPRPDAVGLRWRQRPGRRSAGRRRDGTDRAVPRRNVPNAASARRVPY
ncbi:MAG: hypothetical protein U5L06_10965 [Rhodovibrio sp.]|nr:hypothetical protein [Rhodovibrio sp.]